MSRTTPRYLVARVWSNFNKRWTVLTEERFETPGAANKARAAFEAEARERLKASEWNVDKSRLRIRTEPVRYINFRLKKGLRETATEGSASACREDIRGYLEAAGPGESYWVSPKACWNWKDEKEGEAA